MLIGKDMARKGGTAVFFWATLLLWSVLVIFEVFFNQRKELSMICVGFAFFQAANWVLRRGVSRDPLFVNTAVSLLHSLLTSVSVIVVLVNEWMNNGVDKMFEHKQLFGGTWLGAYTTICFSCGYFAYDQLDMLRYRLYSGWLPSILAHHLVLLLCFTLALYRHVTVNYLLLTLVCELHSIFLHARKLRRMIGVKDGQRMVVRVEWAFQWASFFIARLICHLLITCKLILDASKFGKGIELPLALLGMAGMNLLNVSLGVDLFRACKREKVQQRHQE
ncbi:hypothetical protein HPP92_013282 [Vanilla planifolia]|uniref:TLC domain-containing protein n=1 Tax=Vanilla planifolia TaxID=51239 RepID=A0A835R242_VANPL|nr:hypothetical protein HPP92_013282 [Vanilla planifolia]